MSKTLKAKPPTPLKVFLSYSRKDSRYVDDFESHLKSLNAENELVAWFIDRSDLSVFDLWKERIIKEIMAAHVFIVFLSADALASKFVKEEIGLAVNRVKKEHPNFGLVPFRIRKCKWEVMGLDDHVVFPKSGKCLIDIDNKDDAYDELAGYLLEIAQKRIPRIQRKDQDKSTRPRPWHITENILQQLDGNFYKIEKTLSMSNNFWGGQGPQKNEWHKPLGTVYFGRQAATLRKMYQEMEAIPRDSAFFKNQVDQCLPKIVDAMEDCRLLFETSQVENIDLLIKLDLTEQVAGELKDKLLWNQTGEIKKQTLPRLMHYLNQLIHEIELMKTDFGDKRLKSNG